MTTTVNGAMLGGFANGTAATFNKGDFWTGRGVNIKPIGPVRTAELEKSYTPESKHTLYEKPLEQHHFATDKHSKYTIEYKNILDKYGLSLNKEWNIRVMPHRGRHPNEYHDWVLEKMNIIDRLPNMTASRFQVEFEKRVIQPVLNNPEMLTKRFWMNTKL